MTTHQTRIAVIGAGTMGRDIALAALARGIGVQLIDRSPDALTAATERIERGLRKLTNTDASPVDLGELRTGPDVATGVAGISAAIEAVPEVPEIKHAVLAELIAAAPDDALIASNTSTLSIGELAAQVGGCERIIGMHFFNPAHRMPLVEVITAPTTSEAALAQARQLCTDLDKTAVVVRDTPGFVTSRLGLILGNEAMRIVEEGVASAGDVDTAMRLGYRHPMGPLELADLVGLDARLNNLRSVAQRMARDEFQPPAILEALVESGRLGRKSGEGFYRYREDGSRINREET